MKQLKNPILIGLLIFGSTAFAESQQTELPQCKHIEESNESTPILLCSGDTAFYKQEDSEKIVTIMAVFSKNEIQVQSAQDRSDIFFATAENLSKEVRQINGFRNEDEVLLNSNELKASGKIYRLFENAEVELYLRNEKTPVFAHTDSLTLIQQDSQLKNGNYALFNKEKEVVVVNRYQDGRVLVKSSEDVFICNQSELSQATERLNSTQYAFKTNDLIITEDNVTSTIRRIYMNGFAIVSLNGVPTIINLDHLTPAAE